MNHGENGPQAIETRYRGCRFRSRLEARWAVFLDYMETEWEYEKEGFHLPGGGLYLPDFWLPRLNAWLEIKGQPPTQEEFQRCRLLRDESNQAVALFYGPPGYTYWDHGWEVIRPGTLFCWDLGDSSGGGSEWDAVLVNGDDGELRFHVDAGGKVLFSDNCFDHEIECWNTGTVKVDLAAEAARSARFEWWDAPRSLK